MESDLSMAHRSKRSTTESTTAFANGLRMLKHRCTGAGIFAPMVSDTALG